jgi:hypothetical protein
MSRNALFEEIDALQQEIRAQRPPRDPFLKRIKDYYRIGLTYSSNVLEKAHVNDEEFILLIARMVKETQKDYLRLFT